MTDIERLERHTHFREGEVRCIKCGKTFWLFFNGGELDSKRCCGYLYRLEHMQVDLAIYYDPDCDLDA